MPADGQADLAHPEAADWVLGTLGPAGSEEFQQHVTSCGHCQVAVAEFGHVGRILQHLPPAAEPAPDLGARTIASVLDAAAGDRTETHLPRLTAASPATAQPASPGSAARIPFAPPQLASSYRASPGTRRRPAPMAEDDRPAPMAEDDRPAPMAEDDRPAPMAERDRPAPMAEDDRPAPMAEDDRPAPMAEHDRPAPMAEHDRPAGAAARGNPAAVTASQPPLPRRRAARYVSAGAVIAVIVAAIVFVPGFSGSTSAEPPVVNGTGAPVVIPLHATPGPAASGQALAQRMPGGWSIQLSVHGLKPLAVGEFYECWFAGAGDTPGHLVLISAGTFSTGPSGAASVSMWSAADPRQFRTMEIAAQRPGQASQLGRVILSGVART